jgi:hypothetical protein
MYDYLYFLAVKGAGILPERILAGSAVLSKNAGV